MSNDRGSLLLSVGMVAAGMSVTMGTLWVAGLTPWSPQEEAPAPVVVAQEESGTAVQVSDTPAHRFVADVTAQAAEKWEGRNTVDRALPPFPLACTDANPVPAVASASLTLNADAPVQVFTVVYPAGQGAAELDRQLSRDHLRACTAGASGASVRPTDGLGAESYLVTSTWNGRTALTRVWRHGDVVVYAVVDKAHSPVLGAFVPQLDDVVVKNLGDRCVSPGSSVADADRSPFWAPNGYRGWVVTEEVSVPDLVLPDAPTVVSVPAGVDAPTEWVVPLPTVEVAEVERPAVPEYPVWPDLPAALEVPTPPDAPVAPSTSGTVEVVQEDPAGPGCGWAFTGESAPVFDAERAAAGRLVAVTGKTAELTEGVNAWEAAVAAYWAAWPGYLQKVAEYGTYAEEVAEAGRAWAGIAEEWRAHEEAVAAYERAVADRAALIKEQERALAAHEAQVKVCTPPPAGPEPVPAEEATPVPAAGASPTPAPSPTPQPVWTPPM